jgi:hypothetical protein
MKSPASIMAAIVALNAAIARSKGGCAHARQFQREDENKGARREESTCVKHTRAHPRHALWCKQDTLTAVC